MRLTNDENVSEESLPVPSRLLLDEIVENLSRSGSGSRIKKKPLVYALLKLHSIRSRLDVPEASSFEMKCGATFRPKCNRESTAVSR